MFLADGQCRANALFEEGLIHLDPLRREHTDGDFRFRIVEPNPQKPLPVVFDLDQFAIRSRLCEPQDRAVINPGMPRHNAVGFASFEQDGGQRLHGT